MATIFDLIMSMLIGATILVIVLTANDIAAENQSVYNGDMLVQEMLITTAQMVEGEFRNMGFGVPETKPSILYADTSRITFLARIVPDTSSTVDTITYSLGPTSELAGTKNELDRLLHRKVNSGPSDGVAAVTIFKLRYFTPDGDSLQTPVPAGSLTEIHVVEVTLEVQNPYAIGRRPGEIIEAGERDALYSSSLWQQTRLASQNSRR